MKTNTGFDLLAPIYDSLARIVFGKSMIESQTWFLKEIPAKAKILILGGGTGWILEKISEMNCSHTIWYVEISSRMVKKAAKRNSNDEVHFIRGKEDDIPEGLVVDVIITNFYLDLFSDEKLNRVLNHVHRSVKPTTVWLVTDFVENSWWQRWMLKFMYAFFRIVCRIDGNRLPDWASNFHTRGWRKVDSKDWFGRFIRSSHWIRSSQHM